MDFGNEHDGNANCYTNNDNIIVNFLDSTFMNRFDVKYSSIIKEVRIPVIEHPSNGPGKYVETTILQKAFILSTAELGVPVQSLYNEGVILQYFQDDSTDTDSKRIAYNSNGSAKAYWTRTGSASTTSYVYCISSSGTCIYDYCYDNPYGVRPAMIIDSNAMFNDNGELLIT